MKISVVIPVFNSQCYLEKCLNSIINQTYSPYEIILIDDGSTDSSGDICDKYSDLYKFIRTIHVKNGGVSFARNIGIKYCEGDYITFIDSDDYIELNMFEELSMFEGADVICSGILCETGSTIKIREYHDDINSASILLQNREIFAKLFKRNVIKDIRFSKYAVAEDLRFLVDLISVSDKLNVVISTQGYYHYIENQGSVMKRYDNYDKFYESIQNEIEMYKILSNKEICVKNIRLIENGIYNFLLRYMNCAYKTRRQDKFMYRDVKRLARAYKNVIFSYKSNLTRFIFHILMIYFPGMLGVYIRLKKSRQKDEV